MYISIPNWRNVIQPDPTYLLYEPGRVAPSLPRSPAWPDPPRTSRGPSVWGASFAAMPKLPAWPQRRPQRPSAWWTWRGSSPSRPGNRTGMFPSIQRAVAPVAARNVADVPGNTVFKPVLFFHFFFFFIIFLRLDEKKEILDEMRENWNQRENKMDTWEFLVFGIRV